MNIFNTRMMRLCLYVFAGQCLSLATEASPNAQQLKTALANICKQSDPVLAMAAALGGVIELRHAPLLATTGVTASRHRLLLTDGSRIRLDLHRTENALRQVVIEVFARYPDSENSARASRYKPVWWIVTDGACKVVVARKLNYTPRGGATSVDAMKSNLLDRQIRLQLDPPVPAADSAPSRTISIKVAMIDSGVNYLLPEINRHLARDPQGRILGFDYWDMDPRPFDANPAKSAFVPQRHGTRTASVLLSEAPMASLVPYRYPRPKMARMRELVKDAADKGIVIVNLSLGSDNLQDWQEFAAAARAHPQMLFIASAGNNDRNIDERPVYPAALELKNLITVSSADPSGLPARGSNWGPKSVDLLVPAEHLIATNFNGVPGPVSGSSHAAARLSAMAVCMLAQHPGWRAPDLKKAIFALAQAPVNVNVAYVRIGLLPAPAAIDRGVCKAEPLSLQHLGTTRLSVESIQPRPALSTQMKYRMAPITLVWIRKAGWQVDELITALSSAAAILGQCGVAFGEVSLEMIAVPRRLHYYETTTARELMQALKPTAPSVWFVRDTLMQNGYEAQAIGRSNSSNRRQLTDSLWLTRLLQRPGLALAHEFYHLLADSGRHTSIAKNLMNDSTSVSNTRLEDWQCQRLTQVGTAFGHLHPY